MRKTIITLMMTLLLVMCFGCEQKKELKEVKRVVVFAKDETNSGLVLFYDEDFNLIMSNQSEYPYMLYYDNDAVYISEDGKNYSSILFENGKPGKSLSNILNPIDILYGEDYFSYLDGGFCKINHDGSEICHQDYVACLTSNESYVYYIDSSNILHVCDIDTFQQLSATPIESSDYLAFTKVDGQVYIVQDKGLTLVDGLAPSTTYVYPNDFTELNNVNGRMIFFEEMGESVVYLISFDKYRMILTPYYNEEYYRNIDFDKEFKDYLDQGYDIVDFYELEYR